MNNFWTDHAAPSFRVERSEKKSHFFGRIHNKFYGDEVVTGPSSTMFSSSGIWSVNSNASNLEKQATLVNKTREHEEANPPTTIQYILNRY